MNEDSKALEDDDDDEFSGSENKRSILTLMRNMMQGERNSAQVDIFDDNNHAVYPTFWGKESQVATCRHCGKTGDTLVRKKCGVGNICCSCCFFVVCLWILIPCVCCFACDVHHYCFSCNKQLGIKTLI